MMTKLFLAAALMLSASYENIVPGAEGAPRGGYATMPPAPYGEAGPADSLYRLGRDAINNGDFRRAAAYFAQISDKYPRSEYAADAPYWRAFALYKSGRTEDLREARKALETQQSKFPKAGTIKDGEELIVRVHGLLAAQGDVESAEALSRATREAQKRPCVRNDQDTEIRAAAMNALLQMDAENALPIIKQVLAKKDECSVALREKAVFLLSQKRTSETETILLDVLNTDPAASVREQAVFWMGQVRTDRAAAALEQIATSSKDVELRTKAIHALHETNMPRAAAAIRRLAESDQTPDPVREQAIFWLGQRRSQENADFLKGLFTKLGRGGAADDWRNKIMFSVSQMRCCNNAAWLLGLAVDNSLSAELRGHALWTAGQAGVAGAELVAMYDRVSDTEVKEKLIWVLSESRDRAATDKLIDIARTDKDHEMRKKALFWLGQKNDPRVRQILTEILTKP